MPYSMDIRFPAALRSGKGPSRTAFRRAVENRMRPRFNQLKSDVRAVMKYQKLENYFEVIQTSTPDSITFSLENEHPAAGILLVRGGTPPHIIEQEAHVVPWNNLFVWAEKQPVEDTTWLAGLAQSRIAERGVIIPHPGTEEDTPLWREIDEVYPDLQAAAGDAMVLWINQWGEGR